MLSLRSRQPCLVHAEAQPALELRVVPGIEYRLQPPRRPGHLHGDVFGLIVRARNYFSNLGAQLRTVAGGEVAGYTRLLTDSRNEARERMWREARARGANAVVAMRFDCNEIGDIMSEVAAYGTAVPVEPLTAPDHGPGGGGAGGPPPGGARGGVASE